MEPYQTHCINPSKSRFHATTSVARNTEGILSCEVKNELLFLFLFLARRRHRKQNADVQITADVGVGEYEGKSLS